MEKTKDQQIKFLITTLALFIIPLAFFQNCAESEVISQLKSSGLGTLEGEVSSGVVITTHPTPEQIVIAGEAATLSVGVLTSQSVQYQWYKDGQAIPQANNYKLTFSKLTAQDSGEYYVVIRTSEQSVQSNKAKLIVTTSSVGNYISTQPKDIKIAMNQTGLLSSNVAGQAPKYVVWYKDGTMISENDPYYVYSHNGQSYSLKILAVNLDIQGQYRAEFVYDNEKLISEPAKVEIKPLVGITLENGNFARIWAQPGKEQDNMKAYCIATANTSSVASYVLSEPTFSQYVAYDGNVLGDGKFRIFSAGMSGAQFFDEINCGN